MDDRSAEPPTICILDGAVDMTGSLMAARREAALLSDRARFLLVLTNKSRLDAADLPEFAEVRFLPLAQVRKSALDMILYPFRLLRSAYLLASLLSRLGCSRLQVNDVYLLDGMLIRGFGFKGIIVTWVRLHPARLGSTFGRLCLKTAQRTSQALVSVSEHIRTALLPDCPSELLYDPVSDTSFRAAPGKAPPVLLFIGNYIRGKGQDMAIEAFACVAAEFADAQLHFYGSDMGLGKNRDFRHELELRAQRHGLQDRIMFFDFVEDTAGIFCGTRAALNLSESESFSLACQEASGAGLPVIATRSGGPAEIIEDGVSGFLVPVGDVNATADRMRRLLGDPAMAAEMGRCGAKLVRERFPASRFREALVRLFDLDQGPPAASRKT